MDELFSLGQWIKRRRKARDLTQDMLAQRVGCSLETIRKIETDVRRPSRQIADRLADQLGLAAEERTAFLQAARAELAVDQLAPPTRSVPQSALVPSAALPRGTVTFLFTDIEGSTRLWAQYPQAMGAAVARHEALLRDVITEAGGVVFKTVGDALCTAFASALDAVTAALAGQRVLCAEVWGATGPLHVRMALHTGVVEAREGDYFGLPLSRVARILAAAHGGQVLLSHVTQELARDQLPPGAELYDLGAHYLKDLDVPEQIFQLTAPDLPTSFPPLNTLHPRRSNLPMQPTPLIGREREIADISALLRRTDARLLTLSGPGGTGKTRLALQVAAELLDTDSPARLLQSASALEGEGLVRDGAWFVNLAPISDPTLVVPTIAQTLGVKEGGGYPLIESLKDYLRERHLLLLLDNFEQVLSAAPLLAELLAAAPGLKILVTSREVLHLRGEKEFPVPPLELPALQGPAPIEALSQYAAVQLFIARALDVKPAFAVTNENAPAVAEICVRLDGLPLAIELAAARVKLFAPEALLARLSNRLALLTGGRRDVPARQQTLRNTIAWSYNLLDEGEKKLFMRLSVFVGGWTLEAAEAVCTELKSENEKVSNDDHRHFSIFHSQFSILDGMASLMDKSLLRQIESQDGEPRFVMLETVREYALEWLAASGEDELIHCRHAAYFLALAQVAEPKLRGPDQGMWLARLEVEHDNLRAALRWALDYLEIETGLQLAGALFWFWYVRNHYNEGRAWLARLLALAASRGAAAGTRVKALHAAGALAYKQDDYAPAAALLEASLTLAREVGDTPGIAASLFQHGLMAHDQGDYDRASALCEESLRLYREIGDRWGVASSLWNWARVMQNQGNYEQATALYDESLMVWQELGDKRGMAFTLNQQGLMAQYQGDYDRARGLSEKSLHLFRELEDKWGVAKSLFYLGRVAQRQGDYDQAVVLLDESLALFPKLGDKKNRALSLIALGSIAFEQGNYGQTAALGAQSLRLCRDLGYKWGMAAGLEGLAGVAAVQSQPERAARLFGAAMALRETIGATLPPDEHPAYERTLAATRAQLDEASFAAAWAEGRAMTLEQAIAYALEGSELDPVASIRTAATSH